MSCDIQQFSFWYPYKNFWDYVRNLSVAIFEAMVIVTASIIGTALVMFGCYAVVAWLLNHTPHP
jgi:hypothetical protein